MSMRCVGRRALPAGLLVAALALLGPMVGPASAQAPGSVTKAADLNPDDCTDDIAGSNTTVGGITVDREGRLYVAQGGAIRGPNRLVVGLRPGLTPSTDPEKPPATQVRLGNILALAVDPAGTNLYFAEEAPGGPRIWHVNPTLTDARLDALRTVGPVGGLAVEPRRGELLVGEKSGSILRLGRSETPVPVGTGPNGLSSLAVHGRELFMTADGQHRILRIDLASGSTDAVPIAGSSEPGFSGDGFQAHLSTMTSPKSVTVDPDGRYLYFIDGGSPPRVRRITLDDMTIDTVVGPGGAGAAGSLAVRSAHIAADDSELYVADLGTCQVLRVDAPASLPPPPEEPATGGTIPPDTTGGTGGTNADRTASDPAGLKDVTGQGDVAGRGGVAGEGDSGGEGGFSGRAGFGGQGDFDLDAFLRDLDLRLGDIPGMGDLGDLTGLGDPSGMVGSAGDLSGPGGLPSAGAPSGSAPEPELPGSADGAVAVPPAPTQIPGNVGLAGTDVSGSRGASRYAMVRNDDPAVVAWAATLIGTALVTLFACAMLAVPRPARQPGPRPRGAY